jgi:hypothetical protein
VTVIPLLTQPLAKMLTGLQLCDATILGSAAWLAWFIVWVTMARKNSGPLVPVLMALALAASGLMLILSNNIKPSQGVIALTGTAAVAAVVGWLRPNLSLNAGAILAWTFPLLGLGTLVHFYSYTEPPAGSVGLILLAPLLALAGDLPAVRRWSPRRRATLRLVPFVLALAAAVGLSVRQYFQAETAATQHATQQDEY